MENYNPSARRRVRSGSADPPLMRSSRDPLPRTHQPKTLITVNDKSPSLPESRPRSWPHSVYNLLRGLIVDGISVTDASPGVPGRSSERISFDLAIKEAERVGRVLRLNTCNESVLCDRFFEELPKGAKQQARIWEAFSGAPQAMWILLCRAPEMIAASLPSNWGSNGFGNVCLGVILDGSPDGHGAKIEILLKTPCRFRLLWLTADVDPSVLEGCHKEIHWVVADPISDIEGGSSGWVDAVREACNAHEIPFFCNDIRYQDALPSTMTLQVEGTREHPFGDNVDLRRSTCFGKKSEPVVSASLEVQVSLDAPQVAESTASGSGFAVDDDRQISAGWAGIEARGLDSEAIEPDTAVSMLLAAPYESAPVVVTKHMRFLELDGQARVGFQAYIMAGLALFEIREHELWREGGFASWRSYVTSVLGISENYGNRLIKSAMVARELEGAKLPTGTDGKPILPTNESQARALGRLPDRRQRLKVWRLAIQHDNGVPTAATVESIALKRCAKNSPVEPPKAKPSERRKELIGQLRQAAEAAESWELVQQLVIKLEALG